MMNQWIGRGHLVKDPELKYTPGEEPTAVATYRIGCARDYGEETDFFSIKAWGKQAEFAAEYFKKGMAVEIIGRYQVDQWQDEKGNHSFHYIRAEKQYFGEKKKNTEDASVAEEDYDDSNDDFLDPFSGGAQ
ncbi:single-stranded DNA-binding protein [Tyzzerella sp. OttesenSCG-928-J15]|nr:single-stranded DNA-binding protein [Tyzzerella sp. OttesenSCG-928-J15]